MSKQFKEIGDGGAERQDRFGHPIDPIVGYARGRILRDSVDDEFRRRHANKIIRNRITAEPEHPLFNFTGLHRNFLLNHNDLAAGLTEEWTGPARFMEELELLALDHMGAGGESAAAVFNRCSAGIVATILAFVSPGEAILSVVPQGRSHSSIFQGARITQAQVIEVEESQSFESAVQAKRIALAILTGVTSELDILTVDAFNRAILFCRSNQIPIMVDDAYGSRLRPVLMGQPKTCEFDVDLGITSCDKAGMLGPRAGLLVGKEPYVYRVVSRASELGLEARPPLAAAVLRSLEKYTPELLQEEIDLGITLYEMLTARFGSNRVYQTAIGPSISEEDILEIAVERAIINPEQVILVPAEVSCALGMILLRDWGIITVNASAQPGARVSFRLKPAPEEVERFGGVDAVLQAIEKAFNLVGELLGDQNAARKVILDALDYA